MPNNPSICLPIDPFRRQPAVHNKTFPDLGYLLELCYLSIPQDVPAIIEWLAAKKTNNNWKNENPQAELSETFRESLQSDHSQSFMVMQVKPHKSIPLCQLELDQLYGRNPFDYWQAARGDYHLRILVAPRLTQHPIALYNTFQTFFEYVVQFPEVQRLLTAVPEGYPKMNDLLARAGWQSIQKLQLADHRTVLYGINRETLVESYRYINTKE